MIQFLYNYGIFIIIIGFSLFLLWYAIYKLPTDIRKEDGIYTGKKKEPIEPDVTEKIYEDEVFPNAFKRKP